MRVVSAAVERANSAPMRVSEQPRRAGDPPVLVADANKIRHVLDWQPRCDDLDLIARTSLAWERKLRARQPLRHAHA